MQLFLATNIMRIFKDNKTYNLVCELTQKMSRAEESKFIRAIAALYDKKTASVKELESYRVTPAEVRTIATNIMQKRHAKKHK